MFRLNELVKNTNCPRCGVDVIITLDTDGESTWIHEIWKSCGCVLKVEIVTIHLEKEIFETDDPNRTIYIGIERRKP